MLSGAQFSWPSAGWRSILYNWWTFNTSVHPPGHSCADKAGGNGDLCENLHAAIISSWKFDQDALMLSSVSEMYPRAVICLFWAHDSICVAHRFWLPCHIFKKSWILAILCNYVSTASLLNSKSLLVSDVFSAASSTADIQLLTRDSCLTSTFS